MESLSPGEISEYNHKFNDVYDEELRDIEQRLNEDLPEQGYVSRQQLKDIIDWKLAAMQGRRNKNIERLNTVSEEYIEKLSEAALLENDPKLQLKTLKSIPGIGAATATLVLAFYDPENYAIGDRYIKHALLGKEGNMTVADYPKILDELNRRNPTDLPLRTVEKAYYLKYCLENGVGDWLDIDELDINRNNIA